MSEIEIVVAQSPAQLDGPEARFEWLAKSLNHSSVAGADLLLLPELFITGYNVGEKVNKWCEPADGFYAEKIAALCKKHQIAIHYGFAESDQNHRGKIYNSANCFGKDGSRLGGHRKLLLPPGYEGDHFTGGDSYELFSINNFNIGTLICYDAEFPENFRQLAKIGVEIMLVPTALTSQWGVVAHKVIPTRAFENGVYVCYANQAGNEHGLEYLGASCIVGPDGNDIQRAEDKSEFLRANLKKEQIKIAQERLPYLIDVQQLPIL